MSKNTFGGINGYQVNKVGSVVGYKFRGEQVYRGYQKNVANPRTTAQVRNRTKFSNLSTLLRQMSTVIRAGYFTNAKGTKWSQRNLAYKTNYPLVYESAASITPDYSHMYVSKGNLSNVVFGRLDFTDPSGVSVAVSGVPYEGSVASSMEVWFVLYSPTLKAVLVKQVQMSTAGTAGTISIEVPTAWLGLEVHAWGFVQYVGASVEDADYGTLVQSSTSDSQYLGTGEIG